MGMPRFSLIVWAEHIIADNRPHYIDILNSDTLHIFFQGLTIPYIMLMILYILQIFHSLWIRCSYKPMKCIKSITQSPLTDCLIDISFSTSYIPKSNYPYPFRKGNCLKLRLIICKTKYFWLVHPLIHPP